MSTLDAAYRAKRISHEELIGLMKPGHLVTFGTWLGQSHGVMKAIAQHGREIDPLYVAISHATGDAEFLDLPNVYCLSSFLGPFERAARRDHDNVFYTPLQYTDAYRSVRENRPIDFLVKHVTPMDERDYFNLSLNSSWEYDALRWARRHSPTTRIVFEVNRHLPRVRGLEQFGNNEVHLSEVDFIVEHDAPLYNLGTPPPTETEQALAANVARLIEDRATIQLGFGSLPMVIGKMLAERRDLGIHSEMFCQAHVDLIEAGAVSNVHKGLYDGVSVATFALGEDRLYRWLADNPAFAMLPVEEINAVPALARVRQLTSINSVLTIDLSGQACAHCLGPQTYSGLGGAFEFAYGAQLSPGGKSITCLPSTKTLRDGREVSNIVARHPLGTRISLPEHCVDWVVTEYGAVRLKFLNLEWRAAALIDIAHPKYREELAREAAANGLELTKRTRHRPPPARFFSGKSMLGRNPAEIERG